jgi:hypothetical protein
MLGLTHAIWPAHPQWAVFFLTLAATVILRYIWPEAGESLDRSRGE